MAMAEDVELCGDFAQFRVGDGQFVEDFMRPVFARPGEQLLAMVRELKG